MTTVHPDRRTLLRIGGVSLAASALELFGMPTPPPLRSLRGGGGGDHPPPTPRGPARQAHSGTADAVLFLWLPGGVTHHESFDPKPDAPPEVRGEIRPIATNVPGVHVAEVLPCLARHMD